MKERSKKVIFSVGMLVLICAICFAVLEFVFARFYYSDVLLTSHVEFEPTLGWRPKPGTYWVKPPETFRKHSVYVNDFGLRNRDISATKPTGTGRVVMLGDSFTYGKTTPSGVMFPVQAEALLNRDLPQPRFEVVNAGVMGYGTAQELLLMRELGKNGIVGDIYLLVVFTNDILDNLGLFYYNLSRNQAQPLYALHDDNELFLKEAPEKAAGSARKGDRPKKSLGRTKITRVLKVRIGTFLQKRPDLLKFLSELGFETELPRLPGVIHGWYNEDFLNEGVPLMNALMGEIKKQAEEYDSKLLVCFIPSEVQVYPETYELMLRKSFPGSELVESWSRDKNRPQRMVGEMCENLGIPYLDLLPIMAKNNDKTLFTAAEGHLSKDGHLLAAQAMAEFVRVHMP